MKYTTLTKMADSVMYEASDEQLDHPAVAGGVSVWGGSKISNPRPGCKIRDGGPGSHSIPEDKRCADLVRKSLAEWRRRALGGELPPRVARPCDCSNRAPPETSPLRVRVLLSRGSHASWTRKGNAEAQTSLRDPWSRAFLRSTRRAASPLRSSCLVRGFSVHPYICVRHAHARCIGVRRRRQKSPAHSRHECPTPFPLA